MQISVIIPVYNAERFVAEAVESALAQPEVEEVLLIDDVSLDDTLTICRAFEVKYPDKVRVIQHPLGLNQGPAETRNAGLRQAQCPYVAFLDADDVYLAGRFSLTSTVFQEHPDAAGVHETVVTTHFQASPTEVVDPRAGFIKAGFDAELPPERLFQEIAMAKKGYIHLDGLVIKRSALDESLFFDPVLRQSEDTDFLLRWSASRLLYAGDPSRTVSLRRVHDANTVFNTTEALHYRHLCMHKCALHEFYGSTHSRANWEILNRMARATRLLRTIKKWRIPVTPIRLSVILFFLCAHPRVLWHFLRKS